MKFIALILMILLSGCGQGQTCTMSTFNPRDSYTGACDSGVVGGSGEIAIGFDVGRGVTKCAQVLVTCPLSK